MTAERKWIAFFVLSGLIAWLEAVATANAGTSIHHTSLFLIQWYGAIAIAAGVLAKSRNCWLCPAVFAAVVVVCVRALGASNALRAEILSYDPAVAWTNADQPLAATLLRSGVQRVIVSDWGIST